MYISADLFIYIYIWLCTFSCDKGILLLNRNPVASLTARSGDMKINAALQSYAPKPGPRRLTQWPL